MKRWRAVVTYTTGLDPDVYEVEELEEIHDLVEAGPDFGVIKDIRITYLLGGE